MKKKVAVYSRKVIVKVYTKTVWQSKVKYDDFHSSEMSATCDRSNVSKNIVKGSKVEKSTFLKLHFKLHYKNKNKSRETQILFGNSCLVPGAQKR